MVSSSVVRLGAFLLAATTSVLATPVRHPLKHLGTLGPEYTAAVATKDLVFISGAVPTMENGTIPEGIEAQTAFTIQKITALLEEAGTSWEYVLKTTVFLAEKTDYPGMNEIYGQVVPNPKPARTSAQVAHLPGEYLIEMDAIAAIPRH